MVKLRITTFIPEIKNKGGNCTKNCPVNVSLQSTPNCRRIIIQKISEITLLQTFFFQRLSKKGLHKLDNEIFIVIILSKKNLHKKNFFFSREEGKKGVEDKEKRVISDFDF
jgi:hypothetical protein